MLDGGGGGGTTELLSFYSLTAFPDSLGWKGKLLMSLITLFILYVCTRGRHTVDGSKAQIAAVCYRKKMHCCFSNF